MDEISFEPDDILVISASENAKQEKKYVKVLVTDEIGSVFLLSTKEPYDLQSGDLINVSATNGELLLVSDYKKISPLDRFKNTMKVFRNLDGTCKLDGKDEKELFDKLKTFGSNGIDKLRLSYTEILRTLMQLSSEIDIKNEGLKNLVDVVIHKSDEDIKKKYTQINTVKSAVKDVEYKLPQTFYQKINNTKEIRFDICVLGNAVIDSQKVSKGAQATLDAFNN